MMLILLVVVLVVVIYLYYKINYSYWERRGVPGPKPWIFVGNIGQHFMNKKTLGEVFTDIYKKFEGYPFVGVYRGGTPCLLVRDAELMSRVFVKDHNSFHNNEFYIDKKSDPLFGRNPFILRDQEWKDTRKMLSPGLTSGKIKNMFAMLHEVSENFIKYIENQSDASTTGLETRSALNRFTLENVAKCAFGIDGKCFEEGESEFKDLADNFLTPDSRQAALLSILQIFPKLGKIISVRFVRKDIEKRLINMVSDVIKHRKNNNIVGNDYLQFLIQLSETKGFDNIEITAHVSTFFVDGYHTSALVMSYVLLCLAEHPEIQRKLRDEIMKAVANNNGQFTYESLNEMQYLHACVYESLRYYTIIEILTKLCTQPYEYTSDGMKYKRMSVKLSPGDIVVLPYGIIGKDEKYFPDADKYIPERWLDKEAASKFVFVPFGDGPRVCIGQRFGLLQVKLGVAQIIKHFELSVSLKTKLPIKLIPWNFLNEVAGGVWLKYKKISK